MVPAKAKKVIKVILIILLAVVLIVGGYVAYVMIDYHRIEDNQALQINDATSDAALVDTEYKVISYNIGFAAYTPDFGFFMDGGTQSRAESEESVIFLNQKLPISSLLKRSIKMRLAAITMTKRLLSEICLRVMTLHLP